MAAINIDETYLTGQFQEFYREVIHQKRAILAKTDKLLSTEKEENADAGKQTVKTIHSRLRVKEAGNTVFDSTRKPSTSWLLWPMKYFCI